MLVSTIDSRPFPLRFELPSPAKQLRVERVQPVPIYTNIKISGIDEHNKHKEERLMYNKANPHHWRIWLMANGNFTLGTFLQLLDNGAINRVTWHEDGTEDVFEVKEAN
jgi:hypothetical protein